MEFLLDVDLRDGTHLGVFSIVNLLSGACARFEDHPVFSCGDSPKLTRQYFGVYSQNLPALVSCNGVTDFGEVHLFGSLLLFLVVTYIALCSENTLLIFEAD